MSGARDSAARKGQVPAKRSFFTPQNSMTSADTRSMTKTTLLRPGHFETPRVRPSGRYIQAGQSRMYYETYGHGRPLLLLHGGLSTIEGLRFQIPFFSKHFKVILPERPGHGRSPDIEGPYTYEKMARQMAHFMDALHIKKARLMGYSDGANLLYWLAAKRHDLVDRFISVGGNIHHAGCEPLFQKALKKQKIELDPRYAALSPDGERHYAAVFEKCRQLWLSEPKWKKSLLRKIKSPVLVAAGDRDMIQHEHTLVIFRNIANAQLTIVSGATHSLLKEKPKIINPIMLDFLKQVFQ